jgi:hypothetical protein
MEFSYFSFKDIYKTTKPPEMGAFFISGCGKKVNPLALDARYSWRNTSHPDKN